MKNNKIQFILCLVISVLCWNNAFGMSDFEDTYCEGYVLDVNQSGDIVEYTIYNPTDFGPYHPDVISWYIEELGIEVGDSTSVSFDLSQTPPNLPPLTLCVDYIAYNYLCTLCTNLDPAEANCEYEIASQVYGLELWGNIYSTNWQNGTLPSDVTWILEGGGGVIGTGTEFNYTFDEPGTYLICAEYADELTECEGVLCDSIVINDFAGCDSAVFEYEYETTPNGTHFYVINPPFYDINNQTIEWYADGNLIGTGNPFTYFLNGVDAHVCAVISAVNIMTGEVCVNEVCQWVEFFNNNDCDYYLEITQADSTIIAGAVYGSQNAPPPTDVIWILENGGGIIGTGPFLTYQFDEPGEYIICAEYFDELTECTGFLCQDVLIEGGNTNDCGGFGFEYEVEGNWAIFEMYYPDIYEVDEDSIQWSIDGQVIEYGNPVDYNFTALGGSFTVCASTGGFNIQTEEWCDVEVCHDIVAGCPPIPIVTTTANDSMFVFELPVSNIEPFLLQDIFWYVNGNIVSQGDVLTYVFPESGTYDVCVSASLADPNGNFICTTDNCILIEVELGEQNNNCEAFFEWQDNGSPGGTLYNVGFTNLSSGNYTNLEWSFGNGETGSPTEDSFVHLYEDLGVYNVCLTVWNNMNCQDTHCELVFVSGTPSNDECNYEIVYETLIDNLFVFALVAPDSTLIEAEWYNGETGEGYGIADTNISIVFTDYGVNEICAAYETPFGSSCSGQICTTIIVENPECENTDCVFPGDANSDMVANNYDVLPLGLYFSANGPVRSDATIGWYGQPATDWQSISTDSIDLKHVDCDGDGEIFFNDIDAIEQNYNRTHNGVNATRADGAPGLHLEFDLDTIYPAPDSGNIIINADIIMGTADLPVEEIYGVAFSVAYPADLVDSSSVAADYFMDSWMGDPTTTLQLEKNVISQSVVDFGYSRTDQQNISGFGQIGTVSFVMTDNIIGKISSDVELNFPITNIRAILNTGEEVAIMGSENVVVVDVNDTSTATNNPSLSQHFNIFPNPTPNTINITINDLQANTLTLYNTVGQQVLARQIVSADTQVDVSQLPSGMYLLSIQTDKGFYNEKIIVE